MSKHISYIIKRITQTYRLSRRKIIFYKKSFMATHMPKRYYSSEYFLQECGGFEFTNSDFIPKKFHIAFLLLLNKKGVVLDYGCGRGEFADFLYKNGCDVLGVDISSDSIKIAKEIYPAVSFKLVNTRSVPDGNFSSVFLMDVVEHIRKRDIPLILNLLRANLAEAGEVIVHTNDAEQDAIKEIKILHPEHITLFSARQLAALITNAGMDVTLLQRRHRLEEGYSGGLWCVGRKRRINTSGTKRVLIKYNATLGDQMCLTPVVAKYKQENPYGMITVHVEWPEIYINNPYIDRIIWTKDVNHADYDKIFNIQLPVSLLHRGMSLQDASAEQMGITLLESEKKPQMFLAQREKIIWKSRFRRPEGFVVGFSPYARWPSREWPIQRWVEVTEWIEKKYNATILYLGDGKRPYPWIGNNLGGLTDVRELALVLEQCDFLLSVDNGISHLAAAMETPSITLFGPVLAETRAVTPLAFSVQATGCVGCWTLGKTDTPPRVCPKKHNNCMLDITSTDVIKTVEHAISVIQPSNLKTGCGNEK